MNANYLYIARSLSDPIAKKHNVYKVGHSTKPLERIQTLGGSGSTETYEPILIVALPRYVKDIHILAHRSIQKYVVNRHDQLIEKYVSVFGTGHMAGIMKRREIVMFGPRFAVTRIKKLFRRIIGNMSSRKGDYTCMDADCIQNGGASCCPVCTKFTSSLLNCITYQQGARHERSHRLLLENVASRLVDMLSVSRQRKWKGPGVGTFWILQPDVGSSVRFRLIRVLSNDRRTRTSKVQEWSPSRSGGLSLVGVLQSRFTTNSSDDDDRQQSPIHYADETLSWEQTEWYSMVHMRHFKSFCRIANVPDVTYTVQQWTSSVRESSLQ